MKVQHELWSKIFTFQLDINDAQYSFTQRLAFENGWSIKYTQRVIDEYKKFLYLSLATGKPLTPSDEVDQAWHLHLIYSRSYWHDLFRDTLDHKGLHHGPTKGGQQENLRYNEQYNNTLDIYREAFGPEPQDIWPPANIRFGNNFQRISIKDNMIINKNKVKKNLKFYIPLGLAFLAGFLMSATESTKDEGLSWFWWLIIIAGAIFVIRGLYRYFNRNDRNKGGGSSSSGDSDGIFSAFFGCGSGCSSSGCSSSGCSGCGGGGCGGCGGCGS